MKRSKSPAVLLVIALFVFIALDVILAFVDLRMFLASMVLTFAIIIFFAYNAFLVRSALRSLFVGNDEKLSASQRSVLLSMKLPILVTDSSNTVLWYNTIFKDAFLKKDIVLEPVGNYLDGLDPLKLLGGEGTYDFEKKHFAVYTSSSKLTKSGIYLTYFFDRTELVDIAEEYQKTRPAVFLLSIDNYDELMKGLRDSDKSSLIASADRFMEDFINSTNGILRKISQTLFFAVIEEQHVEKIIADRFKILDTVKSITSNRMPMTLSIGVGKDARSLYENQLYATQALDIALGRGGDQAAVKSGSQFSFFGGTFKEFDRRSTIKSRTIAASLSNLIKDSANVVVMGHKLSDVDAIGAAIGLARMATAFSIPVNVCVDKENTLAESLIEYLSEHGYGDLFVSPQSARSYIGSNTLLIIVDTQIEARVEAPELLRLVKNLVIIDHHRKAVNHIQNSTLFHHDSNASSCSELVTEMLQFVEGERAALAPPEALALLAGIMLDTKNYTIRTSARTFDASAYLRRNGAEPIEAKLLFATTFEVYKSKANIVSHSYVYRGCAISTCDHFTPDLRLAVPQAADDMLNIDGVNASVVAYKENGKIHLSARSLGAYNVQLIMELLGGGGHLTMAGAQLDETDFDKVAALIEDAINKYIESEKLDESMGV